MTITEIGCQVVKAGVDIMDETTHEGKILMKTWKTATSEKTGPYRIYWGMEVENPTNLWCFFDFESLAHHQKFLKEYGVHLIEGFGQILDPAGGGFTNHIDVQPLPMSALKSPVTEVMLAYFASDISAEAKAAASERFAQFADKGLKDCPDVQAVDFGWGLENNFPVRGGEEGQQGSMLTALIGWPSIDAHMKYRETDAFKETVDLIRGMEGLVKIAMFHIKCRIMENESTSA